MDTLTVRVEARPDAAISDHAAASSALQKLVKNKIGVTVEVSVLEPGGLERSIGKARRLIDQRPEGLKLLQGHAGGEDSENATS